MRYVIISSIQLLYRRVFYYIDHCEPSALTILQSWVRITSTTSKDLFYSCNLVFGLYKGQT